MNNQPNTDTDLMNDKLVTMAFITTFTGLTDKWFYKLIVKASSRSLSNWGVAPAGGKAKSNAG